MSKKGSFNIDKLNSFISSNEVTLIGEYSNVTRNTMVSGVCKTTDCNNNFIKIGNNKKEISHKFSIIIENIFLESL